MKCIRYFILIYFFVLQAFGSPSSIIMENDYLTGTDKHYTNGIFYSYMNENVSVPWLLSIDSASQKDEVITFSQLMFTPRDLKIAEKQNDDIPYAGYIGLSYSLFQSKSNYFHEHIFSFGAVGPISLAEQSQKNVHKLIDTQIPQGWNNQLGNKAMAGTGYHFGIKTNKIDVLGLKFDWISNARYDFGNFYRGVLLGTTIRFGNDLPENFYTGGNFIGGSESTLLNFSKSRGFNWHFAAGFYFNDIQEFYIVNEVENNSFKAVDFTIGKHFSLNMQYNSIALSIIVKSTSLYDIELEKKTIEKWGKVQVKWNFK